MMDFFYYRQEQYEKIIKIICDYKGIEERGVGKLFKDTKCKYMLFLLLKKYRCCEIDRLKEILGNISDRSIKSNIKKAEKKFFTNKEFRDEYLEIEEITKKIT